MNDSEFNYDSFDKYENDKKLEEENRIKEENNNKKHKIIKIVIIILVILLITFLTIFLIIKKKDYLSDLIIPDTINVNDSTLIDYVNNDITELDFSSSNLTIIDVNYDGYTGLCPGEASIIVTYKYKGIKFKKEYPITVIDPNSDNASFKVYGFESGKLSNKDVTLTLSGDVDKFTYKINYGSEIEVKNNKIVISENGRNNVYIYAYKGKGKESKDIVVNIDKVKPSISLNYNNKYEGKDDLKVCAACRDNESDVKNSEVCKTYKESATNQVLTCYDKAGNSSNSEKFDIKIIRESISCTLDIIDNVKGTVKATITGDASKKGFKSDYSDNVDSKNVKAAGRYTYYVSTKNGTTNTCSIEVKTKTQYRAADCKSCALSASLEGGSTSQTTSCITLNNTCSTSKCNTVTKRTCTQTTATSYVCKCQYGPSCSRCGQKDFGSWQNTKIDQVNNRNVVETRTYFYK